MIFFKIFLYYFLISQAFAKDWHSIPEYNKDHECYRDLILYCNNKNPPTVGDRFDCLSRNLNQVKAECKSYLLKQLSKFPCTDDIQRLCYGEKQNIQYSFKCLRHQVSSLGKDCREEVRTSIERIDRRLKALAPCAEENKKLCPGMVFGYNKCLKDAYAKKNISQECRKAVEVFLKIKN